MSQNQQHCTFRKEEQLGFRAERITFDGEAKELLSPRESDVFPPELVKLGLERLQSVAGLTRHQTCHSGTT